MEEAYKVAYKWIDFQTDLWDIAQQENKLESSQELKDTLSIL